MMAAAVLLVCTAYTMGRLSTDGTFDSVIHEAPPSEPHDAPPPLQEP